MITLLNIRTQELYPEEYFTYHASQYRYSTPKAEINNYVGRDIKKCKEMAMILNYPFIEKEWNHLCETYPTQKNLFAKYISKMKLASFKNFSYSDSDYLNKEWSKNNDFNKGLV